jgi:predicted MFS family arabinose efflux permease
MMLLATGGFMLMPFGSAYLVNNVGIALTSLPTIYLITGVFTIFIGRWWASSPTSRASTPCSWRAASYRS